MNLTCKIIFNIKILKFWIIIFVIDLNENHIKKYDWIYNKKNELIMNFSNDDIVFVM
jgi:hypothetical protein